MYDEIETLLQADPLPEDAEAQLDALLARLPADERDQVGPAYHEALAVARSAEGVSGFDDSISFSG